MCEFDLTFERGGGKGLMEVSFVNHDSPIIKQELMKFCDVSETYIPFLS